MNDRPDPATYQAVLASARWKRLRARLLRERGERCERCRASFTPGTGARHLSLHHLTYERLGHELDEDVQLLCETCHAEADRERAEASAYQRRVLAWACKVYGFDVEFDDRLADEFDQWLEWKGEEGDEENSAEELE